MLSERILFLVPRLQSYFKLTLKFWLQILEIQRHFCVLSYISLLMKQKVRRCFLLSSFPLVIRKVVALPGFMFMHLIPSAVLDKWISSNCLVVHNYLDCDSEYILFH